MKEFNSIFWGILVGLGMLVVSLLIYYFLNFTQFSLADYLYYVIVRDKSFVPVSLFAVFNMIIFFVFLNKQKYQTAKGVIISTIVMVIALVVKILNSLL